MQQEASLPKGGRRKNPFALLFAFGVAVTCGGAGATQVLAWAFDYDPALGAPVFIPAPSQGQLLLVGSIALGTLAACLLLFSRTRSYAGLPLLASAFSFAAAWGPVYAPYRFALWMYDASAAGPAYAWVSTYGMAAAVFGMSLAGAALVPVLRTERRERTASHGTAAWGNGRQLMLPKEAENEERNGKPGADDFLLGRKDNHLLTYSGSSHLMTIAPTGSGKGVSSIITNLLRYRGSVIVTDPKGENYRVTRRFRNEVLGQQCEALDPFGAATDTLRAAFNPLDLIPPGSIDAADDAALLASMLITEKSKNDQFWDREAQGLLSGLILYVCTAHPPGSPRRTLCEMRRLLTLPRKKSGGNASAAPTEGFPRRAFLPEEPHGQPRTWGELMTDMQRAGGLTARAAHRMLQKPVRERGSVLSSAHSHTHFLDSPRMEEAMGHSTFHPEDLRHGDMSLYFILPPHRMRDFSGWLRLMIAAVLLPLTRSDPPRISGPRILFLLDEFANLGRMDPIRDAVSLMRGYGFCLWFFLQDLAQLEGTYERGWETFMANTDVLQAFRTTDPRTSEYVSKQAGERTIFVESASQSLNRHGLERRRGESSSISEKGRQLIMPDEMGRMDEKKQVLLVGGQQPVLADRVLYYEDKHFGGRADPNPMVT